jgi:hypothetical protein
MKTLSERIKEVALAEVGVKEVGTNIGPRVNEYKACCKGLNPKIPWYWCAAFICWVVKNAMVRDGRKFTFKPPTTAAAYGFDEWSLAQDNSTKTARKHTGESIGIFSLKSVSHCGIAITAPDKDGWFATVEGNTNGSGSRNGDGVYRKKRHISDVRDWITFRV